MPPVATDGHWSALWPPVLRAARQLTLPVPAGALTSSTLDKWALISRPSTRPTTDRFAERTHVTCCARASNVSTARKTRHEGRRAASLPYARQPHNPRGADAAPPGAYGRG